MLHFGYRNISTVKWYHFLNIPDCCSYSMICFYLLTHYNHITMIIGQKSLEVFCKANNHPFNSVAISISRYLVKKCCDIWCPYRPTLTGCCCIHFLVRRGLYKEAERCTCDPTSTHDLRKRERGAHGNGQHASERREQTAAGHRQAPGPHSCHRRLRHPGGGRAVPSVCKYPDLRFTDGET